MATLFQGSVYAIVRGDRVSGGTRIATTMVPMDRRPASTRVAVYFKRQASRGIDMRHSQPRARRIPRWILLFAVATLAATSTADAGGRDAVGSGTPPDCNQNGIPDDEETYTDFTAFDIDTGIAGPWSTAAADLDGDHDPDVIYAARYAQELAWHSNLGDGIFGPKQSIALLGQQPTSVLAADLNGDGANDVVFASLPGDRIGWIPNETGTFDPSSLTYLDPGETPAPQSIAVADLDGDGDLDLLYGSTSYRLAWFDNLDGAGTFSPGQQIVSDTLHNVQFVDAADLDGDHDLDIVAGEFISKRIVWFENTDGAGRFGPQRTITDEAGNANAGAATDLDGDGDLDVLGAWGSGPSGEINWYENTDGAGSFGEARLVSTFLPSHALSPGDMDGDGDVDFVAASPQEDRLAWFANLDGLGTFSNLLVFGSFLGGELSIRTVDLDGDGDVDVLSSASDDGKVTWYRNDNDDCNGNRIPDECDVSEGSSDDCNGNGLPDECEADCNGNGVADTCDLAAGTSEDCDGDMVPDECQPDCNGNGVGDRCDVAAGTSLDCASNNVPDECEPDCNDNAIADGCDVTSGFSDDCGFNGLPDECELEGNDCNGDGVPDECQLEGNDCNENEVLDECDIAGGTSGDCNANGSPDECDVVGVQMAWHPIEGLPLEALSAYSADLDGDGDLDAVAGMKQGPSTFFVHYYENTDGQGTFGAPILLDSAQTASIVAADLDGDGDRDLLAGQDRLVWYENLGGGSFGPARVIATFIPFSVFVADLDDDGDGDLLATDYYSARVVWFENLDGAAHFGAAAPIATDVLSVTVGVADLDGDLDLDVLHADGWSRWNENLDGAGTFGPTQAIGWADGTSWIRAADLDDDGDSDVVVAAADYWHYDPDGELLYIARGRIAWFANLGGAESFAPIENMALFGSQRGGCVQPADLNGDGEVDLLSSSMEHPVFPETYGTIGWHPGGLATREVFENTDGARELHAGDIDGDGDLDVLSAGGYGLGLGWHENLTNDCNGNIVPDSCEPDTDGNGIADACDPDCNTNGVVDAIDVGSGASEDCDGDGVPDECQPDCNENDVADICELGSLVDCAPNGILDECEPDCNGNGQPDGCDVVFGIVEDCDNNGVPDECDTDCNANELPDACDIETGTSLDCNVNGVPDECDVPGNDCNGNGVPDDCEAEIEDCNGNGYPDDCDIAGGGSPDCNFNGRPDECDDAVEFMPRVIHSVEGYDATSAAIGDLDLDGDPDFVVGVSGGIVAYVNQDASDDFVDEFGLPFSGTPESLAIGDISGNGYPDVVVVLPDEGAIYWHENLIGSGFGPGQQVFGSGARPVSVAIADLDGDGDLDLASASSNGDRIAWYENRVGMGGLVLHQVVTDTADGAMQVLIADVDGDGDPDLLSAAWVDGEVSWYENTDGQGTFGPPQLIGNEEGVRTIFVADLDGDEHLDVLAASSNTGRIEWYRNGGEGFEPSSQFIAAPGTGLIRVSALDLDADGDLDVLTAIEGAEGRFEWYENLSGLGDFGPARLIMTDEGGREIFGADLDNDLDHDVVTVGPDLVLHENLRDDCNDNGVPDECEPGCIGECDQDDDGLPSGLCLDLDCLDDDGTVWSQPGPAQDLMLSHVDSTTWLIWQGPLDLGGIAVHYDVLRSTGAFDFEGAAICLAEDATDAVLTDADEPGPDETYYYLIRAGNACPGEGTLGWDSDGSPRTGRNCP
jgi:hypothetical protein